jgi:hypothetical protein
MVGLKCYNKGGFKSILYYFKMNYRKKIGLLLFSTILLYFLGVALDASEFIRDLWGTRYYVSKYF